MDLVNYSLELLHEIEDSILHDKAVSTHGLVRWNSRPSRDWARELNLCEFFEKPFLWSISQRSDRKSPKLGNSSMANGPRSKEIRALPYTPN